MFRSKVTWLLRYGVQNLRTQIWRNIEIAREWCFSMSDLDYISHVFM